MSDYSGRWKVDCDAAQDDADVSFEDGQERVFGADGAIDASSAPNASFRRSQSVYEC